MNNSFGEQFAQLRPINTSAHLAFTAHKRSEITTIAVCNTTGADAQFSIYHNDSGTVYNDDRALYKDHIINANDTLFIELGQRTGLFLKKNGTIGVKSNTANAINFTLYGNTSA